MLYHGYISGVSGLNAKMDDLDLFFEVMVIYFNIKIYNATNIGWVIVFQPKCWRTDGHANLIVGLVTRNPPNDKGPIKETMGLCNMHLIALKVAIETTNVE